MRPWRSIDPVGPVYIRKNAIVRKISHEYIALADEIIKTGALARLVSSGCFPKTKKLQRGDNYFLLHKKIRYYSVAYEWTFDMLKDVVLATLDIDLTLNKLGFEIKDFHFDNVFIAGTNVIFVDFGSIVEKKENCAPLYLQEFLKYCFMPLYLWSKGDGYFASRILVDEVHEKRFFGIGYRKHYPLMIYGYLLFNKFRRLVGRVLKLNLFLQLDVAFLRAQVAGLRRPSTSSAWSAYHQDFFTELEEQENNPRFKKLAEIVGSYSPKTVLDLAGNAGVFSLICSKKIPMLRNIYCCDCDHNAVNFLYNFLKKSTIAEHKKIIPVMMNIVFPSTTVENEERYSRLRSDVVCLLAVTHHILLSQQIDVDYLFVEIKKYSKSVVIIEFMPLGLFDGNTAPPVPSWYTREWFREKFCSHFDLLAEYELEVNRVAFVGKV